MEPFTIIAYIALVAGLAALVYYFVKPTVVTVVTPYVPAPPVTVPTPTFDNVPTPGSNEQVR